MKREDQEHQRTQAYGIPTDTLESRFLLWLLHYPLQRASDLAYALETSEPTIHRILHQWMARGLVEQVTPSLSMRTKHAWYHLSWKGLCLAAAQEGAGARALTRAWRAHDRALLALFPRLHVHAFLQDLIQNLLNGAPRHLAPLGGPVHVLKWLWVRDYTLDFVYHQRPMRCFVDAALLLRCDLSAEADDEQQQRYPGGIYYTLWCICDLGTVGLYDRALMQQKLRLLLRYRESKERQPFRSMFPLVLIFVSSAHQRALWQQAAMEVTRRMRLSIPLSAVIVDLAAETRRGSPPQSESSGRSIWSYNWRVLTTNEFARLADQLIAMNAASLPPHLLPIRVPKGCRSCAREPSLLSGKFMQRLQIALDPHTQQVGNLAREREVTALLALQISARYREILLMLYAHPLLACSEVALFLNTTTTSVERYLYTLLRWGCVEIIKEEKPRVLALPEPVDARRWLLSTRGVRYLAASTALPASALLRPGREGPRRNPARSSKYAADWANADEETTAAPHTHTRLWQLGSYALYKNLRHTIGMYACVAAFVRAAASQPGDQVAWFETGLRSERRYYHGGIWHNFRPDATLEYRVGSGKQLQQRLIWLEWDEGTLALSSLKEKMAAYAHYLRTHEWRRRPAMTFAVPIVLVVVPERGQLDRMIKAAEVLKGLEVEAWVTTHARFFEAQGPLGAIWQLIMPKEHERTILQTFLRASPTASNDEAT